MTTPRITPASWAILLTLGLVWGSTFLIIKIALDGMPAFWVAAARVGFAAALMTLVWAVQGFRLFDTRVSRRTWGELVFVALFSTAVPFMLLAWGQQHVTSAYAGVTMATMIFVVLPLAHVFVPGEQMKLRSTIGFVIGFLGVMLLMGDQLFTSSGAALEGWGRLAVFGTASCYAVSSIVMRRLPPCDPIGLAAILVIIGAAAVIPAAYLLDGAPPVPDGRTFAVLAVLGLIPTAGANVLRVILVRTAGPSFLGLVNYIVPVISAILGAALLGETLPPTLLIALTVILAGMAISQWDALRRVAGRLRG